MPDEVSEILDIAIYKEIASEALYSALKGKAGDPAVAELMEELAGEESKHVRWLTDLKDRGAKVPWHRGVVKDLKISEYLTGPDMLDGAGLQDTLIFAMKREQYSVDFYSRMSAVVRNQSAKNFCRRLVNEELRHKLRLETLYDGNFLGED